MSRISSIYQPTQQKKANKNKKSKTKSGSRGITAKAAHQVKRQRTIH